MSKGCIDALNCEGCRESCYRDRIICLWLLQTMIFDKAVAGVDGGGV